jgi:hypothetical protein
MMVSTNLVDWLDDPVYSWVAANDCVLRVDENDFEIFVGRVLVDPIGIEDSEICAAAANTLFGCGFERSLIFELVDTLVCRFAWNEEQVSVSWYVQPQAQGWIFVP